MALSPLTQVSQRYGWLKGLSTPPRPSIRGLYGTR